MRSGSEPSCQTTPSVGMRSPKSVLNASTPILSRRSRFPVNQAVASGLVKSTSPMPACHWSDCHTEPSARRSRYPLAAPSANSGERWAMYGLIQTQIFSPRALRRPSIASGSGNVRGSHSKSHQLNSRIQKLSVFHFDSFWMREFNWCDFEWDPRTFPDPEAMLGRLKARGLKICVWINPYIAQRSPLFAEGAAKGYLLRRADGSVW